MVRSKSSAPIVNKRHESSQFESARASIDSASSMFYEIRLLEQTRNKIISLLIKADATNKEKMQMWKDLWFIDAKLELGLDDDEINKLEKRLEMTGEAVWQLETK